MKSKVQTLATEYTQAHSRKKRWHKVVTALASVVVFCTVYALIMPAVTMEGTTYCGYEEHKEHTDECYEKILVCTESEEGHLHTDKCMGEIRELTCGLEETDGHVHNEECMGEEQYLSCKLEETDGHVHSEECMGEIRELTCGCEETDGHVHNEECYAEVKELTCEHEETDGHVHNEECWGEEVYLSCELGDTDGHVHDEGCYSVRVVLICGLDEVEPHHHGDECYSVHEELICGQDEVEPHHHGDECYTVTTGPVCGLDEVEPHHHDEECYSVREVPVCGLDEVEPHHHGDECYTVTIGPVCGIEEKEPHVHTDECYEINKDKLLCELEIHEHTLQCYSNPEADLETQAVWENSFASVELSGVWNEDIIAIAETQIGYTESTRNYKVQENGTTMNGITRYGQWYGIPYGDWCAMFCSFCINYAGVENYPLESGCNHWVEKLIMDGYFHANGPKGTDGYEPKPGDLVFFDNNSDGRADHVGFVYSANGGVKNGNGNIQTIEGNNGDAVVVVSYKTSAAHIMGYGEIPSGIEEEETADVKTISFEGDGYSVALEYTPEAKLSKKAQVVVEEFLPGSERYESRYADLTSRLMGRVPLDFFRLFDITIMDGKKEVEPEAPVTVTIEIDGEYFYQGVAIGAIHFADTGVEFPYPSVELAENGKCRATFVQTSFSETGLYGSNPLGVPPEEPTYWQLVTDPDEITTFDQYMVLSSSGYAVGVANNSLSSAKPDWEEKTYDGKTYYELTGDTNSNFYRWVFGLPKTGGAFKNTGDGGGVTNSDGSFITTTLTPRSDGTWRISYKSGRTTYYITGNSSGVFNFANTSTSNSIANLSIYKMIHDPTDLPDDPSDPGSGEAVVKPDYPDYIEPSDSKHGSTSVGEVEGEYWSDPGTSQLEALISGDPDQDGMVLTDKSVIYGDDDYGAFSTYAPNTFGVELSALGQTYAITNELSVQAPLDVVFVLDTSGSMISTMVNGTTSANVMIEALNNVMAYILDENEDNRVGVVCFSGGGTKLLDLGRYTADNDKYFVEGIYDDTSDLLTPSASIQRTDGELYRGNFTSGWYGTYTQHGIATGAKVFTDTEDTTVTRTVTKELEDGTVSATYTATRRPVIILLSDGDPTYCTDDYNNVLNTTTIYGNGNSGYDANDRLIVDGYDSYYRRNTQNNNKGIMGYYTILSAQYYKQQISRHYNTDAYFYSIGLGMYDSGNNSYSKSASGDDYKRAVLNPSAANISHLASCTNGRSPVSGTQGDISGYTDVTCRMLYKLLNNTYTEGTVTVSNYNDDGASEAMYGVPGTCTDEANVVTNPFKATGYDYADGAYFTTQATVDQMTAAFKEAISFSNDIPVHGFILRHNTPVTVSDTIGEGMELKSEPVLRIGGENSSPVSSETDGNTTTYYYEGIYVDPYSGTEIDLSKITAKVQTDDGKQTVSLVLPDSQLPAYTPNLDSEGDSKFYYEALPARLIYQVGLTEESEAAVENLQATGGELTFYTNEWTDTEYAFSNYQPTSRNPYYGEGDYPVTPLTKDDNTTGTAGNAWTYDPECDSSHVAEHLGNNGKLTFTSEKHETAPMSLKKVDEDGSAITTDTAKFEIYRDSALTKLVGTYETDECGELSIATLMTGYTYYLKEVEAPDGYELLSDVLVFKIEEDKTITLPDPHDSHIALDENQTAVITVTNDYATTDIVAEKRWTGLEDGDTTPASVQFQLYADGTASGDPVTLNAAGNWKYTWEDLPVISAADKHEISYTVEEVTVPEGYIATRETGENGEQIIVNHKIGTTTLSVLKKWNGGTENSVQVELLKNGRPTGEYATLSDSNDWYYMWSDLPNVDENGDIVYSVREIVPEGYESDVHLWTGTGDPYGQTAGEAYTEKDAIENGGQYLLVFNGVALAANDAGTGLVSVAYDEDTTVTNSMLWNASVSSSGSITLTNKACGKKLVLNSSNGLGLGGSDNHAETWKLSSSNKLYASYKSGIVSTTTSRYIRNESGTLNTSSSSSNGTPVTLYKLTSTTVEDDCDKGDTHYIIVNTKGTDIPSDLSINFLKVNSDSGSIVGNAELALYRETGIQSDGLIPDTTDRYGTLVEEWTSTGNAETVTLTQNGVYYLVETKAPTGYVRMEEPIVFTVSSSGGTRTATVVRHPDVDEGETFTDMDIPNTPAKEYELPNTGGMGTTYFYALGALLTAGALMYGFSARRKRERGTV